MFIVISNRPTMFFLMDAKLQFQSPDNSKRSVINEISFSYNLLNDHVPFPTFNWSLYVLWRAFEIFCNRWPFLFQWIANVLRCFVLTRQNVWRFHHKCERIYTIHHADGIHRIGTHKIFRLIVAFLWFRSYAGWKIATVIEGNDSFAMLLL